MTNAVKILFHDDSDGYCSALAAYLVYGLNAEYICVQYGQAFPNIKLDKQTEIYILDFSYSREILDEVNNKVYSLKVIDHHASAQEELNGAYYAIFDMTKSGAVLSWEYFHPKKEIPFIFKIVQDRDLWKFDYPESKLFESGIKASGKSKNLANWFMLYSDDDYLAKTIEKGKIIKEIEDGVIANFISTKKFKIVNFRGHKVAVYNQTSLISEMASAINLDEELNVDYTLSYFIEKEGKVILSFRSGDRSNIDVKAIAKTFGGGGHIRSSGASLSMSLGILLLKELYE